MGRIFSQINSCNGDVENASYLIFYSLLENIQDFLDSNVENLPENEVQVCLQLPKNYSPKRNDYSTHPICVAALNDIKARALELQNSSHLGVRLFGHTLQATIDTLVGTNDEAGDAAYPLWMVSYLNALYRGDIAATDLDVNTLCMLIGCPSEPLKKLAVRMLIAKDAQHLLNTMTASKESIKSFNRHFIWRNLVLRELTQSFGHVPRFEACFSETNELINRTDQYSAKGVQALISTAVSLDRPLEAIQWTTVLDSIDGCTTEFGSQLTDAFCELRFKSKPMIRCVGHLVKTHSQCFHKSLDIPRMCHALLDTRLISSYDTATEWMFHFKITDNRLWFRLINVITKLPDTTDSSSVSRLINELPQLDADTHCLKKTCAAQARKLLLPLAEKEARACLINDEGIDACEKSLERLIAFYNWHYGSSETNEMLGRILYPS